MEVPGKVNNNGVPERCEPCQLAGSSTKADGFCVDCNEHMCQPCFDHHLKFKTSRNHVLGMPTQRNTRGMQDADHCKKHIQQTLRYYCRQHDKVACGDCVVSEHHACKMDFIQDVAQHFQESSEMKAIIMKIQRLEVDNEELASQIQENSKENMSLVEKALQEIRKFRKEVNDYLDHAEADIVAEVKNVSKQNESLMSELEETIKQLRLADAKLKTSLDTHLYQNEHLFIRFVENKDQVLETENSVTEIKRRINIKSFTFEPEQKLKEIMRSKLKLGSLKTVTPTKQCKPVQGELTSANTSSNVKEDEKQQQGKVEKSKPTEEDRSIVGQHFSPTDPRLAGFDVGKRVRHKYPTFYDERRGFWRGTVTAVDPNGYVTVDWDDGRTERCKAGARGLYEVELIE